MDPRIVPPEEAARLAAYLRSNRSVQAILATGDTLGLPDWYLGAGCVAQTVWNALHGFPPDAHIRDLDLVYFDPDDLSAESEVAHERRLRERFGHLPLKLDVKNQARVHLWYEARYGFPIAPFRDSEEAIASWHAPAICVGVGSRPGGLAVRAPYGLGDLFGMIVRPNRGPGKEAAYKTKAERWKRCWPKLRIEPW